MPLAGRGRFLIIWSAVMANTVNILRQTVAVPSTTRSREAVAHAEAEVRGAHAFTGRMCAASRHFESQRHDSLFIDPLGARLAGSAGLAQPMGEWILVPRTRYGDDFLVRQYTEAGAHQLVLLGAGMDSRAYRRFAASDTASPAAQGGLVALPELRVFEVDQPTNFDVKEPLLSRSGAELTVADRATVGHDFATQGQNGWAKALLAHGFDPGQPTVWLLEGLLYYLRHDDVEAVIRTIGDLSAPNSSVFHDGVSAEYAFAGVAPGGAPFISGSDDYSRLWRDHAGFDVSFVRNFDSITVDRRHRHLNIDNRPRAEATPAVCRGRNIVLFVEAFKTGRMNPSRAAGHDEL